MEDDPKKYHEPRHLNTETGVPRDEDNVYNAVGSPDDSTPGSTNHDLNPEEAED